MRRSRVDHRTFTDVATGRLLLELNAQRHGNRSDLAFSPDGLHLVVCGEHQVPEHDVVDIWSLNDSHGIRSLRGLSGQVTRVAFSADGRLAAALATNWRVGVWELATGRLLYVADTPKGLVADNAALTFSPDGTHLAFATSGGARLWKAVSGAEVKSWHLPESLCDALAFPSTNEVLLIRFETKQGTVGPFQPADPLEYPRVCRVRNLLAADARKVIVKIPSFNLHGLRILPVPDGSHFVVDGLSGRRGAVKHSVRCFEMLTGKELWSRESTAEPNLRATGELDPSGKLLTFYPDGGDLTLLLETLTGHVVRTAKRGYLGPGARFRSYNFTEGLALYRDDEGTPLVTLGIDSSFPSSCIPIFNNTGSHLAYANSDGTVLVADLGVVQRQLAAVGLGW
jgi:hypothetical protein